MAGEEEFSFPTMARYSSIGSPTLWSQFSATPEQNSPAPKQWKPSSLTNRKSSPSADRSAKLTKRGKSKTIGKDAGEEKQEKMDMLWEDFNDQVQVLRTKSGHRITSVCSQPDSDVVNVNCVHAFRLSKNGAGAVFSQNKAGLLVFLKVVKKLFTQHHNSQRSS